MSVVTVTLLNYLPAGRFRALSNMGLFFMRPFRVPGLRFQKLLGSGIDYGMVPNWATYVFLGVWDSREQARQFLDSAQFRAFTGPLADTGTLWLKPTKSQGLWDKQNPFATTDEAVVPDAVPNRPIAVLTRATIRPRALPEFWRYVPQARARLRDHADALLFGIGVGELPLIQQCTVSVWRDASAVNQYAYRQSGHREVVRLTREHRWYSEELFARFVVLDGDGFFAPVLNAPAPVTRAV